MKIPAKLRNYFQFPIAARGDFARGEQLAHRGGNPPGRGGQFVGQRAGIGRSARKAFEQARAQLVIRCGVFCPCGRCCCSVSGRNSRCCCCGLRRLCCWAGATGRGLFCCRAGATGRGFFSSRGGASGRGLFGCGRQFGGAAAGQADVADAARPGRLGAEVAFEHRAAALLFVRGVGEHLLEALAQGPEDDSLVSLLPEDFAVISSRIENGVCYLNLPASGSLPENEAERDLMLSALEQSILSLGGVDEVQFLIEGSAEPDGYR